MSIFILIPLIVLYLTIGVGAAASALRQFAQGENRAKTLHCSTHGTRRRGYCESRPRCPGITYKTNPDAGKIDSEDLPAALVIGAVWPVASLPALVWWLATRTPTPLAERTRLEEIERKYNEDQEKLTDAGHDDLDQALAEAETEMSRRETLRRARADLRKRVQKAAREHKLF